MIRKGVEPEIYEPRDVLRYLLGQIYRTRNRARQLERSLEELEEWMKAPLSAAGYSPTPRSPGHGDGAAASVIFKIADIEDWFAAAQSEIAEAAQRVVKLVGLLPVDTLERSVCEMRHIALMGWEDIAASIPMSRRHVSRIYEGALDMLLECAEVQQAIAEATADYRRWRLVQQASRSRWGAKNKVGGQRRKTKSGIGAGK